MPVLDTGIHVVVHMTSSVDWHGELANELGRHWRDAVDTRLKAWHDGDRLIVLSDAPETMDLPSLRLHALRGDLRGFWAVTVRANWRIIGRFDGEDAVDVDLVNYH